MADRPRRQSAFNRPFDPNFVYGDLRATADALAAEDDDSDQN